MARAVAPFVRAATRRARVKFVEIPLINTREPPNTSATLTAPQVYLDRVTT
jgi:hypothetical protein